MNDLDQKSFKFTFNGNGKDPNQSKAKTKGKPSIMAYLKSRKIGLRDTQLKLLNAVWLNCDACGVLIHPIEEHGSLLRKISRNWKRDLSSLEDLYLIKYVHVEDDSLVYKKVNNQATIMVNPAINFTLSKWDLGIKKGMIKHIWESGLVKIDYSFV